MTTNHPSSEDGLGSLEFARNARPTQLILIEGIMGAGKTTTAQFVDRKLRSMGQETKLFLEGNLDHPTDYDGAAVLEPEDLAALSAEYPDSADTLNHFAKSARIGSTLLLPYRKAQRDAGEEGMPGKLAQALATFDVYDGISLDKHKAVLQASWHHFVEGELREMGKNGSTSYIFDCAFLQNPVCTFVAMHNAGAAALRDHVLYLAEEIRPLRPALIYLYPTDVRETLERVIPLRSKEWLEAVINYHTNQTYGRAHGLVDTGLEGLIEFLQHRQAIEIDICRRLPFPVKIIPNPHEDWAQAETKIADFLESI